MSLVKITEKEKAEINADASILITQQAETDGEIKEVLYRATLKSLANILDELGYLSDSDSETEFATDEEVAEMIEELFGKN